jgi:hypothetical protein
MSGEVHKFYPAVADEARATLAEMSLPEGPSDFSTQVFRMEQGATNTWRWLDAPL